MKTSTRCILTTHVGSLPRPDDLFEKMLARMDGDAVDEKAYAARVRAAVAQSVRQQAEAGLDVISDGEMGKPSFITYAASRLDGLQSREGSRPSPFANTRGTRDFPDYYQSALAQQVSARRRRALMVCSGPIQYKGQAALKGRPRQSQIRARRRFLYRGFRAGHRAVECQGRRRTNEYYPTAGSLLCSPSPTRCARIPRRSSIRAFCCRSTDPRSSLHITSHAPISASRSAANGRASFGSEALQQRAQRNPRGSRRASAHCYSISAGRALAVAARSSRTSSISLSRCALARCSFRGVNTWRHEHEWEGWQRAKTPDDSILG